jgi:hypothetical protein
LYVTSNQKTVLLYTTAFNTVKMNSNTRTGNWGGRSGGGSAFSRPAAASRDEGAWAAFGGPRDERAEQRRQEREAEAAREAAAARAKKTAEDAAAKKLADATNFTSEESYPSLGGGGPAKPPGGTARNWGAAAKLGAARAAEREAEERFAAAAGDRDRGSRFEAAVYARARPPPVARTSSLTYDYEDDQPDEEDDYAPREPERQRMAYAGDDEEEDDGEFNADIVSGRRRGDKGIW